MDDQMSSDSSSTEFAPSTAAQHRTASLFVSLQSPEDPSAPPTQDESPHNDTLPSLQDRSWIGARMSPILLVQQDNDDTSSQNNTTSKQPQQHHAPLLQDDYYYARLQPPSSSQQQLPHHHTANPFFLGHHAQQAQQQQPQHYAYPSAGHLRTDYPAFGIHPLQSSESIRQMHADQQARQHQKQVWSSWGTLVCVISGLTLSGMAVYDIVNGYYYYAMDDNSQNSTDNNSHAWSLPWGQPTLTTSRVWGGLTPSGILTDSNNDTTLAAAAASSTTNAMWLWPVLHVLSTYGRLVTSAVQVHSVLEWCLVVLGWFVCQRPSRYPISTTTTITVYTLSVVTGQLWMLAVWWIHGSGSNNNNVSYQHSRLLVAHCASWGTCGVLCFVGMVRPQRRFGCFMICIGLVVLSLLQALWILPAHTSNSDDDNGGDNQVTSNNDNSYYDYFNAQEQRNATFLPRNPLPLVVGCAVSSFVGWALYGSQMIGFVGTPQAATNTDTTKQYRGGGGGGGAQPMEQFSVGMPHRTLAAAQQSSVSSGVRFFCAVAIVMAWIIPLLVLAYFDYYYYNHGDGHSNSSSSTAVAS